MLCAIQLSMLYNRNERTNIILCNEIVHSKSKKVLIELTD